MEPDTIRVLRVIEYVGPRDKIEKQLAQSITGPVNFGNGVMIRAATIGQYPEVLFSAEANTIAKEMTERAKTGKVTHGA